MADKGEWAMDSFSETKENDALRLLDLENDAQMLINKIIPGSPTEKERATHNFNNMVFGDPKPITDHLVEGAGRVLPSIALGGVDLGLRGLKKLIGKGYNKLFKNVITKAKLKKHVKGQLKALEEKHGKTLIRELNDKYFKGQPLDISQRKAIREEMKNSDIARRNALGDLRNVYEDPRVQAEKIINGYGKNADEGYKMYLLERNDLVKNTGIDSEELNEIAKMSLKGRRYKENAKTMGLYSSLEEDMAKNPDVYKGVSGEEAEQLLKKRKDLARGVPRYGTYYDNGKAFNFGFTIESDMAKNPERYKGLSPEEASKLFERRKELAKVNGGTKFFDEGLEGSFKGVSDEDVKKINKSFFSPRAIGKQVWRDARIGGRASALELVADVGEDTLRDRLRIHDEPVFKRNAFDKEPDTSFPKTITDNLLDIIGLDFRNPNRYNEVEIQDFLEFAQKEGLLTNDNWKNWTARQQIEKVDEIAHSPYARNFIKRYEER